MSRSVINPAHILDSYRKSDAVIIVCQNNTLRSLEVAALNAEASRVTGFDNAELVGGSFYSVLPERVASTLTEYVDFDDDSHDLLAVLMKIRNFAIKNRKGEEVPFRLRVIRGEEIDKNPWFHLVLVDESQHHEASAFREVLRENFKGNETLNEHTGLPNRLSTLKNIELVVHSVREKKVSACFAVIDINDYEKLKMSYGQAGCHAIQRHIAQICKQKLRPEDAIGTLGERSLGLLLVDAPQEDSRMVLNRLRWMIGVSPVTIDGKEVTVQVNIGFAEIDGKISPTDVLEKCEGFTVGLRDKLQNSIQLAVTHDRRERTERRTQSVPVAVDRRKGDRRN